MSATTPIWQVVTGSSRRGWHDDPVSTRYRMSDPTEREAGIASAALAVQRGQLVVLPTDTVYGVGADAFDPAAVRRLLAAKGRGREMPPPVLVSAATTLDALAVGVPSYARALMQARPDLVEEVPCPGEALDVDTIEDLIRWS